MRTARKDLRASLERLRSERSFIRAQADILIAGDVPIMNDRGTPRRSIIQMLLAILAHPDQHTVSDDMLLAVTLILRRNDAVAGAVLAGVAKDHYARCIAREKESVNAAIRAKKERA